MLLCEDKKIASRNQIHDIFLRKLQVLYNQGGVYMDLDTIAIRPFDDFLNQTNYVSVFGRQALSEIQQIASARLLSLHFV